MIFSGKLYLPLIISLMACTELIFSQDAEQHFISGSQYFTTEDYSEALKEVNLALKMDSTQSKYFILRAKTHFMLEDYNRTIKDCYSILRIQPKHPNAYLVRGDVCMATESFGGAILFYGKTIQNTTDPHLLFEAYLNRGKALILVKRFQDALSDFEKAEGYEDKNIELLLAKTEVFLNLHNVSQATVLLEEAIAIEPDNAEIYQLLGQLGEKENNLPQAIAAYEKYSSLIPEDFSVCNTLSILYLELDDTENSRFWLKNGFKISPKEPLNYKTKGLVEIKMNSLEQGCNSFFRAMQLGYFEKYGYDLLDIYMDECE